MAINAFAVVADFKFDIAGALIPTEKLTNQVEKLSNASQGAINSLQSMGMSYAMQISGLYGGVTALLTKAVRSSEKFKATQIEIANIIRQNPFFNPDGSRASYADGLIAAEKVINRIAEKSIEINLDPDEWVNATKFYNSILAPKGLSGKDMKKSEELARVALKGVPALGIDMNNANSQIMNAMSGGLSKGTLFADRLFAEAGDVLKDKFKVTNTKEFNKLGKKDRLEALIVGLDKLAGSTDAVNDRASLLSNQLMSIYKLFGGINSVLKPLGDVISPIIGQILGRVKTIINTKGRQVIKDFATFTKQFLQTPEQIFVDLKTMSAMGDLVGLAGTIVTVGVALGHFNETMLFMSKVPILNNIVMPLQSLYGFLLKMPIVGTVLTSLTSIFSIGKVTGLGSAIVAVGGALVKMTGLFGIILLPIIGFYRAMQRAKIQVFNWWIENAPAFSAMFLKAANAFQKIISPFTTIIKGFEELFLSVVGGTFFLDAFKWALENAVGFLDFLGNMILYPFAAIKSVVAGLFELIFVSVWNVYSRIAQLFSGDFAGAFKGTRTMDTMTEVGNAISGEFDKTINAFKYPAQNAEGENEGLSNSVVNNNITMHNKFKETVNPDRIAFTIRDQLEKEAIFSRGGGGGVTRPYAQDGRTL